MKLLNNVTWREIPSIRLSGSSHGKVFLLLEKYLGMNASLWSSAVCVVLNFRYFFWVFLWCLCLNYKWQHWLWVLPGAILLSYQSFDVKCWLLSFDACVCVCVYVHPLWRLHLSGTAGTAREQINDVVLKTLDSSAGSLHLYFGMQIITFQLAALSCSYTRSGHSHDLTSIRLAFRT